MNPAEVKGFRVHAAAGKQHICYAAQHGLPEKRRVELRARFGQLRGVVRQVVLHQGGRRDNQRVRKVIRFFIFFGRPVDVFEGFHDIRHILRQYLPYGYGRGKQGFVGVADVEIIFQPGPGVGAVEHGDARCTLVNPAAKQLVPALEFQHGGCLGALGVDKQLLVEGQLIVPGGSP